jgi:hypothetical protein
MRKNIVSDDFGGKGNIRLRSFVNFAKQFFFLNNEAEIRNDEF